MFCRPIMAAGVATLLLGACYSEPKIPDYLQAAADKVPDDVTIAAWEDVNGPLVTPTEPTPEDTSTPDATPDGTAPPPDGTADVTGPDVTADVTEPDATGDATTPDGGGPGDPLCDEEHALSGDDYAEGDSCDAPGDEDSCTDDVVHQCADGMLVCKDIDHTEELCAIDGACVWGDEHADHNPCLVCDPAQDNTAWSVVEDGTLCVNQASEFGACVEEADTSYCQMEDSWSDCPITLPASYGDDQCAPFDLWQGSIKVVMTETFDSNLCPPPPSLVLYPDLPDALQDGGLEWGSTILVQPGEHTLCGLTVPAGTRLQSTAGPLDTRIAPESGCGALLHLEPGASLSGFTLGCIGDDPGEECAEVLTSVSVPEAPEDLKDHAWIGYNIIDGGAFGVQLWHGATLVFNTIVGAGVGVAVYDEAAMEDEVAAEISNTILWQTTNWGLEAESEGMWVEAYNNVYGKVSAAKTTQNVDDEGSVNAGILNGALNESTDYLPTNGLDERIFEKGDSEHGARDIGAVQREEMCLWETAEATSGCDACPFGQVCIDDQCTKSTEACCEEHATPGCDDTECQEVVCEVEVACCDPEHGWGEECVELSAALCEVCSAETEMCPPTLPTLEGESICSPVDPNDAGGKVIHVSSEASAWCPFPDCDTSSPGNGCQVYQVIEVALQDAVEGDIVLVHGGTYEEDACDLRVPAGVHLRSIEGPTETTIHFTTSCVDYLVLMAGATVEGFHIRADGFGSGAALVTLWDETSCDAEGALFDSTECGAPEVGAEFQYNIISGDVEPNTMSFASAVELRGTGHRVQYNTFVDQHGGVYMPLTGDITSSMVWDNLFVDCLYPLCGGEITASGTAEWYLHMDTLNGNHMYCSDGTPGCMGQDPHLDDFAPTDDSSVLLGQSKDGEHDIGAVQTGCGWWVEEEPFNWSCEPDGESMNGCVETILGMDDLANSALSDWGFCADQENFDSGELGALITLTLKEYEDDPEPEDKATLLLGPGDWLACGVEIPDDFRVVGAVGPHETRLHCNSAQPPGSPAGVVSLGSGAATLAGVTVECSAEACPGSTPAILVRGQDAIVSHVIVKGAAPHQTLIEVDIESVTEGEAVVHLHHLTLIGSGDGTGTQNDTGIQITHTDDPPYNGLQVNLINSVFGLLNAGITHYPSEEMQATANEVLNHGLILMYKVLTPHQTMSSAMDQWSPQTLSGTSVYWDDDAPSDLIEWFADEQWRDPEAPLPGILAEEADGHDIGAGQQSCGWLEQEFGGGAEDPGDPGMFVDCWVPNSECFPEFNTHEYARCLVTEDNDDTPFANPDQAGAMLRWAIAMMEENDEIPGILRIGDGDYNVCSIPGEEFMTAGELPLSLEIPEDLTIRSDNGPEATRIFCEPAESGPEPLEQVVLLGPGSELIGVQIDCEPLCDFADNPTVRVASDDNPARLAFVAVSGGNNFQTQSMGVKVEGDVVISHSIIHESDIGIHITSLGEMGAGEASGDPQVVIEDTIFRDCDNILETEQSEGGPTNIFSYGLYVGSNYGCSITNPPDDALWDHDIFLNELAGSLSDACVPCVSAPPEDYITPPLGEECPLAQSGTPYINYSGGTGTSDIGPTQSGEGCAYNWHLEWYAAGDHPWADND